MPSLKIYESLCTVQRRYLLHYSADTSWAFGVEYNVDWSQRTSPDERKRCWETFFMWNVSHKGKALLTTKVAAKRPRQKRIPTKSPRSTRWKATSVPNRAHWTAPGITVHVVVDVWIDQVNQLLLLREQRLGFLQNPRHKSIATHMRPKRGANARSRWTKGYGLNARQGGQRAQLMDQGLRSQSQTPLLGRNLPKAGTVVGLD